jgi:hypothetical protein
MQEAGTALDTSPPSTRIAFAEQNKVVLYTVEKVWAPHGVRPAGQLGL